MTMWLTAEKFARTLVMLTYFSCAAAFRPWVVDWRARQLFYTKDQTPHARTDTPGAGPARFVALYDELLNGGYAAVAGHAECMRLPVGVVKRFMFFIGFFPPKSESSNVKQPASVLLDLIFFSWRLFLCRLRVAILPWRQATRPFSHRTPLLQQQRGAARIARPSR